MSNSRWQAIKYETDNTTKTPVHCSQCNAEITSPEMARLFDAPVCPKCAEVLEIVFDPRHKIEDEFGNQPFFVCPFSPEELNYIRVQAVANYQTWRETKPIDPQVQTVRTWAEKVFGLSLRLEIQKILAAHDPQALIKHGAPDYEYSPEADPMAAWLEANPQATVEEIKVELHSIFAKQFNPKTAGFFDYTAAAKDIFDLFRSVGAVQERINETNL